MRVLWTVACQVPLSMGYFMQEYWNGLPLPASGDLPHPGIQPVFPVSSALQADSLLGEPLRKPSFTCARCLKQYFVYSRYSTNSFKFA